MKKYSIFAAALSLAAIVSCQKEISENQQTTITPEIELESITLCTGDSQSKTSVNGENIVWNEDDKIDIFSNADGYSNAYLLSTSKENVNVNGNGNAAKFSGEVLKGTTDFYAVYPSGSATGVSNGMINITVPTNQTPKVNSFGEGMNISVAKGTKKLGDPQVKGVAFHNVCSYLKFTVPSYIPNVNRVDVTCDRNIAGSTTINYKALGSDKDTVIGSGSEKTITMEGSFAEGSTFWFVLTPGVVNSLTINLTTADGSHWTRTSTKTFTLNIGTPKNLGTIDFALTNASAIHTTDTDGETLNGTEVKVNLGIISSLMSSVTAVNLQVANSSGEVVRTYIRNYNDLDKLTDNSVTFPTNSDWPYLPRGTYTISGTYTIDGTIKNFAQTSFISPKPEFIVNTPSAYTSYDTYKTSGAAEANKKDGSTIYGISNNGVTISSDILSNNKYASIIGGYSYTIDGKTATAGDNANLTYAAHDVVATYVFDGVSKSSTAHTCYVTGLPFLKALPTETTWPVYSNIGNWSLRTSDGTGIFYNSGGYIQKNFYIPAGGNGIDIRINHFGKGRKGSAVDATTFNIYAGGNTPVYTYIYTSTKGSGETKTANIDTQLSNTNYWVKCSSSYVWGTSTYAMTFNIEVLYRDKKF